MTNTPITPESSFAENTVKAAKVGISQDHPRLLKTDPGSIRTFLRRNDQYSTTVLARASQLTSTLLTTEAVTPISLKYCVDVEFLESSIDLGFIEGADLYDKVTDEQVRSFLDTRCKESKETVTLEQLDKLVNQRLRTDMKNNNATARMQDLFTAYHTLLSRNSLRWLVKDNPKVAVQHVLSAIRSKSLHDRLHSDLTFSKYELRKNFHCFMAHAIRLAEAFQIVDSGKSTTNTEGTGGGGRRNGRGGGRAGGGGGDGGGSNTGAQGTGGAASGTGGKTDDSPLCLWEPHRTKGISHFLRECRQCPAEERKSLYAKRTEDLAREGPAKSTRSQTKPLGPYTPGGAGTGVKHTAGRLQTTVNPDTTPACSMEVSEGFTKHIGMGRCDDGSDESIASPTMAQTAVLKGIGRMKTIVSVRIQVALTETGKLATFNFLRTWYVPRLVLNLSAGPLALHNVTFLVADDGTACEDLLVGLPVLRHLAIDSRTLLQQKWSTLTGTDCTSVGEDDRSGFPGRLRRLMLARLHLVGEMEGYKLDPGRPRSNFFHNKTDTDPFPDPLLLQPEDKNVNGTASRAALQVMPDQAKHNGFPVEHWTELEDLALEHANEFSSFFSPSLPRSSHIASS